VAVAIHKQRVEIRDNGPGIPRDELDTLAKVADTRAGADAREQAILTMQREHRAGVLTIFTDPAARIRITNHRESESHEVSFHRRALRTFSTSPGDSGSVRRTGTRLTITRKTADAAREVHVLQAYCRGVKHEILLNGQLISRGSHFKHPLLTATLNRKSNGLEGEVSIPAIGDVCRIWQLDSGIPLSRKVISPWMGYVFEAAVEFDGDITSVLLQKIMGTVEKLYLHLVTRYPSYPESVQRRIETLVFKQHRLGGRSGPADSLAAFADRYSSRRFSLKELLLRAANEPITASVAEGREDNRLRQPVSQGLHLSLTPLQMDFLIHHTNLPLQIMQPTTASCRRLGGLIHRVVRGLGGFHLRLLLRLRRPIRHSRLSSDEREFLKILNFYFTHTAAHSGFVPGRIAFLPGRGISPARAARPEQELPGTIWLLIRRNHPSIRKALEITLKHPENVKIIGGYFASLALMRLD
jgi:hypothetical protein